MAQTDGLIPYKAGHSGNPGGRTPAKWLREFLNAASDKSEGGKTRRQEIVEHLYEVATSWEIKQFGEDIKVASGRDSVEAAKILYAYDMGQPSKMDALGLAEHFRKVELDKVNLALAILGPRILAMAPEKVAEFFRVCSNNPLGFVQAAEQFLRGEEQPPEPAQVEAIPTPESEAKP
jgi:hypothetical protein